MRYLITSALPYINGIKHLGNLAGSMLPADVYARFRRMEGHEVVFICATDEHGTPAELAAQESQQSVGEYCDEQHRIQKDIYNAFSLSFDWFGRTSSRQNHSLTQHMAICLEENGLIEERVTKQIFSIDDNRFLPDRYVEGTCPHCSYENARGDQCDKCGLLLDPTDLINPRSKISGSTNLTVRETSHLFLLQEKMQDRVGEWVRKYEGKWPSLVSSIAEKWLKEGLKDRCITRDLKWGIPVLNKAGKVRSGFENKVFYVWFDAPIGYISATMEWAEALDKNWQRWWQTDKGADDVTYVEFMGKDNVAFHTVSFPITILGSNEPWKMVDFLKAFNWVNWYGDKFSTSQKRGIFMDQALELLPADYWRWYLISNAPEGSDYAFTWETFQAVCNADLSNNLGNFVNRICKFATSRFDSSIPSGDSIGEDEENLFKELDIHLAALKELYAQMEFRKAASEVRKIWSICNEYVANTAPWVSIKTDQDLAATTTRIGLNLCILCAQIAYPVIPNTAAAILKSFNIGDEGFGWPEKSTKSFLLETAIPGSSFTPLPVLFKKIEDDWVATQKSAYCGS